MKIELPVPNKAGYKMLMSNIGCKDCNAFYLLMSYHKSRKGGFDIGITTEQCNIGLQKHNPDFYYTEPPY